MWHACGLPQVLLPQLSWLAGFFCVLNCVRAVVSSRPSPLPPIATVAEGTTTGCQRWLRAHVSRWPHTGRNSSHSTPPPGRRIFEMITFGFELEMLTLHMRVMQPEVAGFLVAEATSTFQAVNQADLTRSKPAVLSEALGNGTFPLDLARLLTVLRSNSYTTIQSCKRVRAHNPAHYPHPPASAGPR